MLGHGIDRGKGAKKHTETAGHIEIYYKGYFSVLKVGNDPNRSLESISASPTETSLGIQTRLL